MRRRLVPRHIQRERARHRAHQTFLDLGLASTRDRTGVLFFASAAEHYVEIITDRVLAGRLPPRAGDVDELPNRPLEL